MDNFNEEMFENFKNNLHAQDLYLLADIIVNHYMLFSCIQDNTEKNKRIAKESLWLFCKTRNYEETEEISSFVEHIVPVLTERNHKK